MANPALFSQETQPISRTLQYRKVMKPMLERKRRARINRCLDELKDLMVSALATDGDNVSKLEKADILEMTVSHLQKLKQQQRLSGGNNLVTEGDKFRSGFTTCAKEVSKCLASIPGVDIHLGTKLMTHLGQSLKNVDHPEAPSSAYTPPASPVYEESVHYHTPMSSPDSRSSSSPINYSLYADNSSVWRPW